MSKYSIDPQLCGNLQPALVSAMLEQLETCGFRFTQEFRAPRTYSMDAVKPETLCKVLVLDTETTGNDVSLDKIVELGLILVEVDPATGQAFDILATYSGREDPGMPIAAEATNVNGITNEMVVGLTLDDAVVNDLIAQADWVIAHNGKFDRPISETRFPSLVEKKWACSLTEVPWLAQGTGSAKLEYIAYRRGLHYHSHAALDDCQILLEVLQRPLPDGQLPMQLLLATAARNEYEVWALNSSFETKDLLQARKYRWKPAPDKVWVGAVEASALEAELDWLGHMVYNHRPAFVGVSTLDARNRFTNRREPYARTPVNQPKAEPVVPVVAATMEQKMFDWAAEI